MEVQGVPHVSKEAPDDQHATTSSSSEPQHQVEPAGEEGEEDLFGDPKGASCENDSSLDTNTADDQEYDKIKSIVDRIRNFQSAGAQSDSETFHETEKTSPESEEQTMEKATAKNTSVDDTSKSPAAQRNLDVEDQSEAPEPEPTDIESTSVIVLRLPGGECSRLCADLNKQHEVVMFWSSKKVLGNVYMAKGNSSVVIGKANVKNQHRISTFGELRRLDCFKDASHELKTVWKNRVLQEKKHLFVWEITCIQKFDKQLEIQGRNHAKHFEIGLSRLKSFDQEKVLPGLDLKETAMFFVNRLSDEDSERLENTMRQLHNKEIKVGTACSGTDIAVSMTKATIEALSEHFNVFWPELTIQQIFDLLFF